MSSHPSDVLKAEPPAEHASAVAKLRSKVELSIVDLELKEMADRGPPMTAVAAPPALFNAYDHKYGFVAVAPIQVRDANGTISRAILMAGDDGPIIAVPDDSGVLVGQLASIRKMPGRLLGWLVRPLWLP